MKRVPGQLFLGTNRIHIRSRFLYFTNTFQGLFARIQIYLSGPKTGAAKGPYEVISYNGLGDDFDFDDEGNAYITQNPGDALLQVTPDGKSLLSQGV
jgi:sugar lactone lactonase YvrE